MEPVTTKPFHSNISSMNFTYLPSTNYDVMIAILDFSSEPKKSSLLWTIHISLLQRFCWNAMALVS